LAERIRLRRGRRRIDPARGVAYRGLLEVEAVDAFANLIWPGLLTANELSGRDAAFATELFFGAARMQGSFDEVIAAASGKDVTSLDLEVRTVLRIGAQQLFGMRTPQHAAVSTTVELAGVMIGERVTGLVNAVIRKMAAHDWSGWTAQLYGDAQLRDRLAFEHGHPRWIVDALADSLGPAADEELAQLLAADNAPAMPMLVVRPGLAERRELLESDAEPARWSPYGASRAGAPADVAAVREGRAGVQDEGSQLVIQAAVNAAHEFGANGPWLDMCAGPGGKSALLRGLAPAALMSAELQPHRAGLVAKALRAYPAGHQVIVADGTVPAWRPEAFSLVVADVPCSGLGALRRRPESRWRRNPCDVDRLVELQARLLRTALDSVRPGGVVAYITCSPHPRETVDIIAQLPAGYRLLAAPSYLPQVPSAASALNPQCIQLFPHRHQSDAMFCALIARNS